MTIEANRTTIRNDIIVERDELVRALMALYRTADFKSYGHLLVTRSRLDDEIEKYRRSPFVCMYLKIKRRRLLARISRIELDIHETQAKYYDIYKELPREAYVHKSCLWTLIDDIVTGRAKDLNAAKELWNKRLDIDRSWYEIEH